MVSRLESPQPFIFGKNLLTFFKLKRPISITFINNRKLLNVTGN